MRVFIAGSGLMGCGIAVAIAMKYNVVLYDISREAIERATKMVLEVSAQLGVEVEKIDYTQDFGEASKADIFIEAVPESVAIKVPVLQKAEKVLGKDAIICSNTSVISINDLAKHVEAKDRFVGLHWMNPPYVLPLVEIVKSEYTSDAIIEKLRKFLASLGKRVIVCKDQSLVNRFNAAVLKEAAEIVKEGVSFKDVDDVWKYHLGILYLLFGPFGNIDYIGLDVVLAASKYLYERFGDEKFKPPEWLERKVSSGELGVKTGRGVYSYSKSFEEAYLERVRKIRELLKFLGVN